MNAVENDVRWLLSFSVESMIRGYHEYKLIWNDPTLGEELEIKRELEIHTICNFLSKYPSAVVVVPCLAFLLPIANR